MIEETMRFDNGTHEVIIEPICRNPKELQDVYKITIELREPLIITDLEQVKTKKRHTMNIFVYEKAEGIIRKALKTLMA